MSAPSLLEIMKIFILTVLALIVVYALFRMFTFGIFKSYFDARRSHYKKIIKEDITKNGR
jgi:hypothetical protein